MVESRLPAGAPTFTDSKITRRWDRRDSHSIPSGLFAFQCYLFRVLNINFVSSYLVWLSACCCSALSEGKLHFQAFNYKLTFNASHSLASGNPTPTNHTRRQVIKDNHISMIEASNFSRTWWIKFFFVPKDFFSLSFSLVWETSLRTFIILCQWGWEQERRNVKLGYFNYTRFEFLFKQVWETKESHKQ